MARGQRPALETTADYQQAGYTYLEDGICRGKDCRKKIEWWETPNGKKIPLSETHLGSITQGNYRKALVPHWTDCPNADDFGKKKK